MGGLDRRRTLLRAGDAHVRNPADADSERDDEVATWSLAAMFGVTVGALLVSMLPRPLYDAAAAILAALGAVGIDRQY